MTGVASVVCTGKGKLSAYLFGLVNSVLYALIAWQAAYYGETMLNLLYYVPMQFVGFFVWSRHMNEGTHEVEKLSLIHIFVHNAAVRADGHVHAGFLKILVAGLGHLNHGVP